MAEEALMDEQGLCRGHVALLLTPSSFQFPVVSLGVLSLGAVLSTANPLLTPGELADQARDSEPFLALTTAELAPKLGSLLPASRVVLVDQLLAGLDGHDAGHRRPPLPGARQGSGSGQAGSMVEEVLTGARHGRVLLATTTWLLELGPVTDELRELPRPATPYPLFS